MKRITLAEIVASGGVRIAEPVGIVRCEPVWEFKPYLLKDYLFFGVLDGVGQASIEGREMALGPGTCLLIPPGAALTAGHDPKRRLRVFYLHLDFLNAKGEVLAASTVVQPMLPAVVADLTTFEPLARQVVEGHAAGSDTGKLQRDLALRLVLLSIASASQHRPTRSDNSKLSEIMLAIRENPGHAWPVTEIASRAGLSASQTARRMHQLVGCSPQTFVIRARIDRACRLMETSNLSLEQIAESLGYSDVYFFHRQFKRVSGVPPAAWRKAR